MSLLDDIHAEEAADSGRITRMKRELTRGALALLLRRHAADSDRHSKVMLEAAAEIENTANGHWCPPGEVEVKFDGGRMALLCPHCRTIVGYARTRMMGDRSDG